MKNCLNVHSHKIDIYEYRKEGFSQICTVNNNSQEQIKYSKQLYAVICTQCKEFNNDFESKFEINVNNYYNAFNTKKPASLFYAESSKEYFTFNNNVMNAFSFIEFNDYILFGTKNEIISYITDKYNALDSDKSFCEKTNKNLKKDYENEKNKNEKIVKENKSLSKDFVLLGFLI